jgi:uncharacterized paraquat-inducible protein A
MLGGRFLSASAPLAARLAPGGRRFLLGAAVLTAAVLLTLAFHLPFMRLSTLVLVGHGAQEHSLISAVHALVRSSSHEVFIGGVLLVLAIFLPLLKLLYLLALALLPWIDATRSETPLRALAWLGRWWPQDLVTLAAMAMLIARRETLLQHTAAGAYCFAAAVLVMALAYTWRRPDGSAPRPPVSPRGSAFAALVGLAVLAFAAGLTLPVVRLANTGAEGAGPSIVQLLLALQARGDTVLAVTLAILAVLLPGLRLVYLLAVAAARVLPRPLRSGTVRAAEALGRHTTTDAMVLALMLFYLMQTRAADRVLQPAVYCLAASAVLTFAAYAWANLAPAAKAQSQPASLAQRLETMPRV